MQLHKHIKNKDLKAIYDHLGVSYDVDVNKIIDYIFKPRFKSVGIGSNVKTFDYLKDFDLLYYEFKKLNIDLIKDDIGWWEFTSILEGITLENNALMKRIGYRSYKVPFQRNKGDEEFIRYNMNKRLQYHLGGE